MWLDSAQYMLCYVLLQAENSYLAAKFSGRWDHKHMVKDGYVFLEFDPYCFNKILSYLRSKAIEGPDHPAPFPVIAPEHEAQFNQLVAHLLLEEYVGLCGMHFLFDKVSQHATASHSGTTLKISAAPSMASLAPLMETGKIYYMRCLIECTGGPELFLGVTSNVTSTMMHPEDAGWKEPENGLSAAQWCLVPHWPGWQESEQYLFQVDLVACILTVRCCPSQKKFQLGITHTSNCPMFFCLVDSGPRPGTKVKLLPVLSQDIQNF